MVGDSPPALALFREDGSAGQPLPQQAQDGIYGRSVIDSLSPWTMALLSAEW